MVATCAAARFGILIEINAATKPASASWCVGMSEKREFWSGRTGFVLATMGSAIGLGSIWKFPYEVGSNGGAAFIVFYLLGLALVVLPLMLVEFAIGRRGGSDAIGSIAAVAAESGAARQWAFAGALGILTSFFILSFYSVIGGWAVAYTADMVWYGLPGDSVQAVRARYDALLASPAWMAFDHACFMTMTALVVAGGVAGGIERACKILMPILIVLIVILAGYSLVEGDSLAAARFFFAVDLRAVTARVAVEALGLGFFSIGVGLAVMITYAAYAQKVIDLRQVALVTIVSDTAISFLAGFAVFPIVFAEKLDPSSGPGLVFVSLPLAFARMPFGSWAALAFFLLLTVAALASAMSMLEMTVALLRRWPGCSRPAAAWAAAMLCWLLGLGSVLSFNTWSGWFPLAAIPGLAGATVFDLLDQLTSNVLLPIGGLALAVFGGWVVPAGLLASELGIGRAPIRVLRILLRYVAPLAIAAAALAPFVL
jgi:NSS family neurotransmitter:Na+ symporter